jgi:hypothetical protein
MSKSPSRQRPQFLSSEEVVQRLLERPELRVVSATCVLPAIRIGGEWRFRRTDLDEWMAKQPSSSCQDASLDYQDLGAGTSSPGRMGRRDAAPGLTPSS